MALKEKRYLDYEGLAEFLKNLKEYYIAEDEVRVGYAKKANVLATARKFKIEEEGAHFTAVEQSFDGSDNVTLKLDLSNYALKEDVVHIMRLKGVVNYRKDLDNLAREQGDCYIVRYKGETGEEPLNAEFVWTGNDWEQFGSTVILDGYAKEDWVLEKIADEAEARTTADNTLDAKIDAAVEAAETAIDTLDAKKQNKLTVGTGIIIDNTNKISVDDATFATVEYVDANISDTMAYVIQEDRAEHAGRVAGDELLDAKKVDKAIESDAGKAEIFNEVDGGGALFTDKEGYKSFVGVNADVKEGIGAQIYDIDTNDDNKGTKIDIRRTGAYYVKGEDSVLAADVRDVHNNEIAVIKDVDNAFNSIDAIEAYKIQKLFRHNIRVVDGAALVAAIANLGDEGGLVTLGADATLPARIAVPEGKDVIIDLAGHKLTAPAGDRALNVAKGGNVVVANGTMESAQNTYIAVVRGNAGEMAEPTNVLLDNVTFVQSDVDNLILATNGNDANVNIVMNDCECNGILYLPARGSITINGGEFEATDKPVMYVKNGNPLNITGAKFTMNKTTAYTGEWGHYNNGAVDAGGALVVEACNYNGQGNPRVNINGGEFKTVGDGAEAYGILLINYNGNTPDVFNCDVPYYKTNNITGHLTTDGKTAPTDGWLKFTREAGQEGTVVLG